jgi:hypothetical protein
VGAFVSAAVGTARSVRVDSTVFVLPSSGSLFWLAEGTPNVRRTAAASIVQDSGLSVAGAVGGSPAEELVSAGGRAVRAVEAIVSVPSSMAALVDGKESLSSVDIVRCPIAAVVDTVGAASRNATGVSVVPVGAPVCGERGCVDGKLDSAVALWLAASVRDSRDGSLEVGLERCRG